MLKARKALSYLRNLDWYIGDHTPAPLCSDLNQILPLPMLDGVRVVWPDKYSWDFAASRLDPIKAELGGLVPIELYDVAGKNCIWHQKGGFPVSDQDRRLIGTPRNPKGANDIRGEVFEVHSGQGIVRCAFDHSDYSVISSGILADVDVYFKCVVPRGPLPQKVVPVGYFPANANFLAKARRRVLKSPAVKKFDVYGRFGSWTDSQQFRQLLVEKLRNSSINFVGGFDVRIYPQYLKELAQAKIALDAPGQAPLSYRLVEAMALGVLVIRPELTCVFPEAIIDRVHYVALREDGSNVVEICQELLDDPDQLQRIVRQAMIFFDRNFSTQSIARRILRSAANRFSSHGISETTLAKV